MLPRILQVTAVARVLLLLAVFGWAPAQAAVSLDNCEAAAVSLSGTSQNDTGFTINAGSNQLLAVMISLDGNTAATIGATWNGVSLTNVSSVTSSPTGAYIFVLKAPTQGNQTLTLTSSVGFTFSNSIACAFNGVDQTTPTQNATNTTASLSLSVTTANGNATALAASASGTISAISPGQLYANGSNGTGAAESLSSSGSTAYTVTGSGGNQSLAGIDIKAAAAAAGCTTHRLGLLGAGC